MIWRPDGGWRNIAGVLLGVIVGLVLLPLLALAWVFGRKWDRTPREMAAMVDAILDESVVDWSPFDSAYDAWFAAEVRDRRLEALRREGLLIDGPPLDDEARAKWVEIRQRLNALAEKMDASA